jgi:uncharacterized protein YpbB
MLRECSYRKKYQASLLHSLWEAGAYSDSATEAYYRASLPITTVSGGLQTMPLCAPITGAIRVLLIIARRVHLTRARLTLCRQLFRNIVQRFCFHLQVSPEFLVSCVTGQSLVVYIPVQRSQRDAPRVCDWFAHKFVYCVFCRGLPYS